MRNSFQNYLYIVGIVLSCGLTQAFMGCDGVTTSNNDVYDNEMLLNNLSENVLIPWLEGFELDSENLRKEIEQLNDVYSSETAVAENEAYQTQLLKTQLAWRNAMAQWQKLELLQNGPLGTSFGAIGGKDLRDRIYSWPLSNPCRIDQEIVKKSYQGDALSTTDSVNITGLDSIEYLLFYSEDKNSCAAQIKINSDGTWAEVANLSQRRIEYALKLAEILVVDAQKTRESFIYSGDRLEMYDFSNGASSLYENSSQAVQEVFNGLFYIEEFTENKKILNEKGILEACRDGSCAKEVESSWSAHTIRNILTNMQALEEILNTQIDEETIGDSSAVKSFADKYALAVGVDEFRKLTQAISQTITVVSDIVMKEEGREKLASDLSLAEKNEVLEKLGVVIDIMKGDMALALTLDIPQSVSGDND